MRCTEEVNPDVVLADDAGVDTSASARAAATATTDRMARDVPVVMTEVSQITCNPSGVSRVFRSTARETPGLPGAPRARSKVTQMTLSLRRRTSAVAATAVVLAAGLALATMAASSAASAQGVTGARPRTATAVDPSRALLHVSHMPLVNQVQDWTRVARRTGRVSTAQPEPLSVLGATRTARRDFALPGASATNVVLTFDSKFDATMAFRQVRTWRWHTTDNIPPGGRVLHTGAHVWVPVEEGRGSYFPFVFKLDAAADEGTFEWLGVTRRERAVSIVAWRVDGQDATYDVDPTIRSLEIANRRLARLG